jgi:hypothetical protein
VLDPQPRIDFFLDDANYHLRTRPSPALALLREALSLSRPIATFATVAGQFLADDALAESDGLRDLDLLLSGLFHIGDYFTVFRTEAVVFITHSQFVVKPAWMNLRLCLSNFYSLTI